MFISKIGNGFKSQTFKGYQHEKSDNGKDVTRFNTPFDYNTEKCYLEAFLLDKNYAHKTGYKVKSDKPFATIEIKKGGTVIDFDAFPELSKGEAIAYRFRIGDKTFADTGMKVDDAYTLFTRNGTTPMVQGAGYLTFPDSQKAGVFYRGFDDANTGEIYLDKDIRNEMENTVRTFSNKYGGNLAGLEQNIEYLKKNGYKVQYANPIVGGDNKSSHHYWNKNNMQISDDMGNVENFASYTRKLFQNGIKYVYDGTFTSEGLEGIHFQYALRWGNKNPQSYYWFRMSGLKDAPIGLGAVPKNKENLRHRVVNAPVIYEQDGNGKISIKKNPNYNPNKETLFQIYDASQVTDEQLAKLDKPIDNYKKLREGNPLAINSHDDTLVNYICQINPEEYEARLKEVQKFNTGNEKPVAVNSADGTILLAQFSNFKFIKKTEGGFVAWDANTDMAKMNYHSSGYDEKIDQALATSSEREMAKVLRERATKEVQDMTIQAGKYWTGKFKDIQTMYVAQTLKNVNSANDIETLIQKGLLPEEARLSQNAVANIINGWYNLEPKGQMLKEDLTVKALMKLPLDTLEFGENTVGVLSTSYFSNRATTDETIGVSRFDLMKQNNPHLIEPYKKTYNKTEMMFTKELKTFADNIIQQINNQASEKLIDKNGNYTEYGEYVINLVGQDIAKYALLKSLTGDKLKTKILPNGEVTYDYVDLKEKTTLKALGINANSPEEEAETLQALMQKGLERLNQKDVDYMSKSLLTRLAGTSTNSFRFAEAIVDKASLGLDWRLDAAKDVIDMDSVRNGDTSFDDAWQNVINFWNKFVTAVKTENPHSYIVAEITDVDDLMRDTYGEATNVYANLELDNIKFKNSPDAMAKFLNETGITSEAGYPYFFTDLIKTFSAEYEAGTFADPLHRHKGFMYRLHALLDSRGTDYIRNLFTFVGNHDKPRIVHGLALDMNLYHSSLSIFDKNGNANFEANRRAREESMLMLSNSASYETLPLELQLNIDNPDYFRTVSTRAVSMTKLLRESIDESLQGVASKEEIELLKQALVDLTNGNHLGIGTNTELITISIPELKSLESALRSILQSSGLNLSESDVQKILKAANQPDLIKKYLVQGDTSWNGEIGQRNRDMIEAILRGGNENTPSGETNYDQYSVYTVGIASILKEAFLQVNKNNATAKHAFLEAEKAFIKKFDRTTVESNRAKLPYYESSVDAMRKNGYAARDIGTAIKMVIAQAEYNAQKQGKLGANQHLYNADKILLNMYKSATEPAIEKAAMMMTFLSALPGIPTMFAGDEFGMSGYEEKAKNVYLPRNALPWSELEEGIFKEYRQRIVKEMNEAMSARSQKGLEALNYGTPYKLEASNDNIPAYLMQDANGNMTISLFNSTEIDPRNKVNYHQKQGIKNKNSSFFANNGINTINNNNPYVPMQKNVEIDHILLGAGVTLPIGLMFTNSDIQDKAVYVVKKIGDKLGIVKKGGGKIKLSGKKGVTILKHVAFRGNSPFNHSSNLYTKTQPIVKGQKLSIIAE